MTDKKSIIAADIIEKATSLGASLAGVARTASLRNAPSYHVHERVEFPSEATSVLVLALVHKEDDPELDWWGVKGGTAGNQQLKHISEDLKQWLQNTYTIQAQPLPYHVEGGKILKEKGGIFLKDAGVLGGLGILGANNLLITPEFGPRVRLRALFLDTHVEGPTDPIAFSPCDTCDMPCRAACPRNAFSSGSYSRDKCKRQMQQDEANKVFVKKTGKDGSPGMRIKYCRACELACPVGR